MRRLLVFAVALVAFIGMLAPPAMAQAPAPKVTITGFIDELGTWTKNMSHYDFDYNRGGDTQAYGRTRGRFDIIGEVGKAKAVLGLELDMYYGQTGSNDNNIQGNATSAGFGASGGFDLNTDSRTIFEIKWLYTEFPLPIPLANTVRLGAQPFGTLANDKLALYANGDFPGVALSLDFTPAARLNLTYVQVEESLTGAKEGFVRGEDWAIITSFGFSPFKGLDIKPMYSFFQAQGPTSGNARQGRGGVDPTNAFTPVGKSGGATGPEESRHTVGLDARFTAGPFSFQPSILYQFGHRNAQIAQPGNLPATGFTVAPYGAIGSFHKSDISAWLLDMRAGFNVGPLSFGLLGMYTSGNKAQDNPFTGTTRYFQPLDTDTSYLADWGTQIFSLGIDYFNILYPNNAGLNPGVAIGYDKYGRMGGGAKVAYAFTPSFTVGFGSTAFWTAEKTDTDSALTSGGLLPSFAGGRPDGDARFLGWEQNLSMTYRFAPGLAFDVAGGYLIARPFGADSALSHAVTVGCCNGAIGQTGRGSAKGVDDIIIGTARVRYSF